ncbi:PhzF family phenazine biosynthesis protein [Shewanella salipaludis]|uniref:PhzF family phenazine biosynthesis protein n=1 Tax=Shewanella salipaludis TaxID=2723052 RepID=A0A972G1T9_9GAMM|nr:PhzF family phenazine biosynthesis protein [Shewanella salipaludis]NMH65971.1 PhzF family phenazine biosynthesis protein [Shewanella salipaludis]
MELEIYVIDAFTSEQFKGNSAAVVPVDTWPPAALMQAIATENNLSETAFIRPMAASEYDIRWFSPLTEIDFCGHATLAASFVLFEYFNAPEQLSFHTEKVGKLTVSQGAEGRIEMSFPNRMPSPLATVPAELLQGLSIPPKTVLLSEQAYFAVYDSEQDVLQVETDNAQLKRLAPFDVVVTSASDSYDFVSRYFWPANGGDEDPVTGSIHAGLVPYWSQRLGKNVLTAYQASSRGGLLYCALSGARVLVAGDAVLYMKGKIYL